MGEVSQLQLHITNPCLVDVLIWQTHVQSPVSSFPPIYVPLLKTVEREAEASKKDLKS